MSKDSNPLFTYTDNDRAANALLVVMILAAIMLVVYAIWSNAKAEEFEAISPDNETYCVEYAQAEGKWHATNQMYKMLAAYADCVSILPTRLEIRPRPGTVPAIAAPIGDWEAACDAEYRTWDASDGTVVRRGSPERVRCPLELREGTWTLPEE